MNKRNMRLNQAIKASLRRPQHVIDCDVRQQILAFSNESICVATIRVRAAAAIHKVTSRSCVSRSMVDI